MSNPVIAFYKGIDQDFVVFVETEDIANKYAKDDSTNSIPLVDVVGTFKIFKSESGRGSDGSLHSASKRDLENQFGKLKNEDIIAKIIKEGTIRRDTKAVKKLGGQKYDVQGY